jgi:fructose-1,6-bisphosphatase
MELTLEWKNGASVQKIETLEQMMKVLVSIPDHKIEKIVEANRKNTENWVKQSFPDELQLISHFSQEFSNQQWREQFIRDLRKITSSA